MNKFLTKAVAALAIGSAAVAAVPAQARDGHWDRGGGRGDWHGDRGDRGRGDWRGDRGYRGYDGYRGGGGYRGYYGYGGPRYYSAPRYYGYGYGGPRYRYYGGYRNNDAALFAGVAGLAIGAAIASGN